MPILQRECSREGKVNKDKKGTNQSYYGKEENNEVLQQEERHPSRKGLYTSVCRNTCISLNSCKSVNVGISNLFKVRSFYQQLQF